MDKLLITSCLGPNTIPMVRAVADYIEQRMHLGVEVVNDISWKEREQLLGAGQIHLGWICGLLYVFKTKDSRSSLDLLAAPVMCGRRYQNRPVYFSDVVVRRGSPFQTFANLRGALWAYNEPRSYSGYYIVLHHLEALTESQNFFGGMVETGAHLDSLQMVINGQADVTVIDSTVLDNELAQRSGLADQMRVIEILGPNPIPPWVISRQLPLRFRQQLRQLLLEMDNDPLGQVSLAGNQLARFVSAGDADYDLIRNVERTVTKSIDY
jgi:phosphonate transport system substrate-binding protein